MAKIKRRLDRYRRTLLRHAYSRGRFRTRLISGSVDTVALPVVMALWSRPERAESFLAELNSQQGTAPLRLMLWNNAPANDERYIRLASALGPGAISSIELRSSRTNLGGIARFFLVAKLRRSGYQGPVVLLDDDQAVGEGFVQELCRRHRSRSVVGVWAFAQHGSYWNRSEVLDDHTVTYVGTGGCVVDASIVDLDGFWSVPDRFSFIEDQWMSYCARSAGWDLRKADIPVTFVLQERNQHFGLRQLKDEFFRYVYDMRPEIEPR